jgi:hypothetical protein
LDWRHLISDSSLRSKKVLKTFKKSFCNLWLWTCMRIHTISTHFVSYITKVYYKSTLFFPHSSQLSSPILLQHFHLLNAFSVATIWNILLPYFYWRGSEEERFGPKPLGQSAWIDPCSTPKEACNHGQVTKPLCSSSRK